MYALDHAVATPKRFSIIGCACDSAAALKYLWTRMRTLPIFKKRLRKLYNFFSYFLFLFHTNNSRNFYYIIKHPKREKLWLLIRYWCSLTFFALRLFTSAHIYIHVCTLRSIICIRGFQIPQWCRQLCFFLSLSLSLCLIGRAYARRLLLAVCSTPALGPRRWVLTLMRRCKLKKEISANFSYDFLLKFTSVSFCICLSKFRITDLLFLQRVNLYTSAFKTTIFFFLIYHTLFFFLFASINKSTEIFAENSRQQCR